MEDALPDTAGVASLLDQLALVQFLLDKLPEAEASARRMSDIAGGLFGQDDAAKAMCNLRLGAVLAGAILSIVDHALPLLLMIATFQHEGLTLPQICLLCDPHSEL